jgi:Undecaprenyl-phosphate glucose phosphotransferase
MDIMDANPSNMIQPAADEVGRHGATSSRHKGGRRLSAVLTQVAAAELIAGAFAAYLSSELYYQAFLLRWPPPDQYISAAVLIATFLLFISLGLRHFSLLQTKPRHWFIISGIVAVSLAFSIFLSVLFLFKVAEGYSRGTFLFQFGCVSVVVLTVRAVAYTRLQYLFSSGAVEARRAILIGNEAQHSEIASRLKETSIKIVGWFPCPKHLEETETDEIGVNAASRNGKEVRETVEMCRRLQPDDILVMATMEQLSTISHLIEALSEVPVVLHLVPTGTSKYFATSKPSELGNITTFQVFHLPLSDVDLFLKRTFDIIVSLTGLIILSPVLLIVAAAIKIDSPGPVLFRQNRHGYNNRTISVTKFRTMSTVEEGNNFKQAIKDDPRVTRVGRRLRQTNIDELPQLIDVLLGRMSIVGPRPHPIALNKQFEAQIAPFSRRHNVKPGISGWAQVNGYRGPTDTLEKMQRRLEYDLYYIDNWSFMLDMKIVLMTLFSKRAYTNAY